MNHLLQAAQSVAVATVAFTLSFGAMSDAKATISLGDRDRDRAGTMAFGDGKEVVPTVGENICDDFGFELPNPCPIPWPPGPCGPECPYPALEMAKKVIVIIIYES